MPGADDVVLTAEGVTKVFTSGRLGLRGGAVSAVDGVSLRIRAGTSLGIVGESGCGKSTLARMLVGLEIPTSGTIHFRGHDLARPGRGERRAVRRAVQMVFQDPYTSLDPRMTVAQIVAEPLAATREVPAPVRRDRVAEMLGLVGLPAAAMERYPHEFSGGQRQRIGIARALIMGPEVLVCDEPVSALDVSVQAQIVNLLRDLQRRLDLALVFIAHDLSVVRHVADRVAVMYMGRLAESGPTDQVYGAPLHPYTIALHSAAPAATRGQRGRLAARIVLRGDPPSPADAPSGCRFRTRCPVAVPRCAAETPVLRLPAGVSAEHVVACHLAEDGRRLLKVDGVVGHGAG